MASSGGETPVLQTYNANNMVPGVLPSMAALLAVVDTTPNVRMVTPLGAIGDASSGNAIAAGQLIYNGASWDRTRTPTVYKQIATVAVGAEVTIWTPAAGKKFRLMGWVLGLSAAAVLTLRDNTAGTIIRTILLPTAVSLASPPEGNGTLSAAANNVLTATSSVAANLTGYVFGTEE